jgi:hypothetical protein
VNKNLDQLALWTPDTDKFENVSYSKIVTIDNVAEKILKKADVSGNYLTRARDSYSVAQISAMVQYFLNQEKFYEAHLLSEKSLVGLNLNETQVKNEIDRFVALFFKGWSKNPVEFGTSAKEGVVDFNGFLNLHGGYLCPGEFNPIKYLNFGLSNDLENLLGAMGSYPIGKCIIYFDVDVQKFVLHGREHKHYRVDSISLRDIPHNMYSGDGGGFGYHADIVPQGVKHVFGGGRFIIRENEIFVFDSSGSFHEMHELMVKKCILGGGAEQNGSYDGSKREVGAFFLRRIKAPFRKYLGPINESMDYDCKDSPL